MVRRAAAELASQPAHPRGVRPGRVAIEVYGTRYLYDGTILVEGYFLVLGYDHRGHLEEDLARSPTVMVYRFNGFLLPCTRRPTPVAGCAWAGEQMCCEDRHVAARPLHCTRLES